MNEENLRFKDMLTIISYCDTYCSNLEELVREKNNLFELESFIYKVICNIKSNNQNFADALIKERLHKEKYFLSKKLEETYCIFVKYLIEQWTKKWKKKILKDFNVYDSIDHLSVDDKENIKIQGRIAHEQNPHRILLIEYEEYHDNFSTMERNGFSVDYPIINLKYIDIKQRKKKTKFHELLHDFFKYKLLYTEPNIDSQPFLTHKLNLTDTQFSSKIQKDRQRYLSNDPDYKFTQLYGLVRNIKSFPEILIIHFEYTNITTKKTITYPKTLVEENFNYKGDLEVKYSLIAVYFSLGNLFMKSRDSQNWILNTNPSNVTDFEVVLEESDNDEISLLVYNKL